MALALDASDNVAEPTPWTHAEFGRRTFAGEPSRPPSASSRPLARFPGYPFALDGLAVVDAARGRMARAVALERRAAERVPLPQFVSTLADLLHRLGDREERASSAR